MPINPNIALSFKPTYELESPQNIEANVMKLQGAKYANELARMQSQEYSRGLQEQEGLRNYLAGNPDLSSSEAQSNAMRFGKPGLELLEAQAKRTKAGNESQESRVKLLGSKLAQSKDALEQYVKTPEQMRQYNAANIADPVIGEYMRSRGITLDQLNQEVDAVEAAGPQAFNRYLQKQVLGAKEFLKANEGKLYFPQGSDNAYVYNPYEGTVAQVPGLNTGAGTNRAANAAPTLTTIVDPENPSRMINVNARTYTGGGANAPGVVGVSGKEPTAVTRDAAQEVKTTKIEEGKASLGDDLENLRESFRALDKMKAITSTSRSAGSNAVAALQSTDVGQTMGKMFGTKEQVERDVINSARSRLVNAIKNATGMSAQQLNSNLELKTMLDSISSPKTSVESAMRIIDDIENAYVIGTGKIPGGGKPSAPSAPAKPAGGVVDFGSLK